MCADHMDKSRESQDTSEDSSLLRRFKLLNLIGLGNYARVYRAAIKQDGQTQTNATQNKSDPAHENQRELAIKSINLTKVSENYRNKFLPRELSILKRISHQNICKIYEIFQVSDRIFIVMQFCPLGTIADLLQRVGPLTEPIARDLFIQTVDAVVYLHSLDYAHRDIKVENILLDSNMVPKLTDFSYSVRTSYESKKPKSKGPIRSSLKTTDTPKVSSLKAASRLMARRRPQISHYQLQQQVPQQNCLSPSPSPSPPPNQQQAAVVVTKQRLNDTFCGTLPYLSPEMIRQLPYDSKKTDSWSLGVSLYVMLNDRIPFPIDDVKNMLKKQMTRDYKFRANHEFSDKCRDLMSQLLEPDYRKRLTTSELSRHHWMSGPREKPPPPTT